VNDSLYVIAFVFCLGLPTLLGAMLIYVIVQHKRTAPPKRDTRPKHDTREKFERLSRKLDGKQSNPLLSALATVCLLVVLYLILFTPADNWPLVVLVALIGLAFGSAARR
jgi:hypothetical protein